MLLDVLLTVVLLVVLSIPLAITAWAFLDAASRPKWVWAFCGRRQIVWMCGIAFGVLTVVGGLLISGYYLKRVRSELARVESGDLLD
ncbi:MAG: hypothetical protein ACR2PK_01560 [Acidimicrobiales bacterium]